MSFCTNCGTKGEANSPFCSECGTPFRPNPTAPTTNTASQTNFPPTPQSQTSFSTQNQGQNSFTTQNQGQNSFPPPPTAQNLDETVIFSPAMVQNQVENSFAHQNQGQNAFTPPPTAQNQGESYATENDYPMEEYAPEELGDFSQKPQRLPQLEENQPDKKKNAIIVAILLVFFFILCGGLFFFFLSAGDKEEPPITTTEQEEVEEAPEEEEAEEEGDDVPLTWEEQYHLGIKLQTQGKSTEAIDAFKESIALNPTESTPYLALVDLYMDMDDEARAIATLTMAQEECKDPEITFRLTELTKVEGFTQEDYTALMNSLLGYWYYEDVVSGDPQPIVQFTYFTYGIYQLDVGFYRSSWVTSQLIEVENVTQNSSNSYTLNLDNGQLKVDLDTSKLSTGKININGDSTVFGTQNFEKFSVIMDEVLEKRQDEGKNEVEEEPEEEEPPQEELPPQEVAFDDFLPGDTARAEQFSLVVREYYQRNMTEGGDLGTLLCYSSEIYKIDQDFYIPLRYKISQEELNMSDEEYQMYSSTTPWETLRVNAESGNVTSAFSQEVLWNIYE